MKLLVAVFLTCLGLLAFAVAQAGTVNFNILDQWDCGPKLKCSIAIDPQQRVVLITTRDDTLVNVVHRGKVIYQEPEPKDKKL